jgi:hypothetical protein
MNPRPETIYFAREMIVSVAETMGSVAKTIDSVTETIDSDRETTGSRKEIIDSGGKDACGGLAEIKKGGGRIGSPPGIDVGACDQSSLLGLSSFASSATSSFTLLFLTTGAFADAARPRNGGRSNSTSFSLRVP